MAVPAAAMASTTTTASVLKRRTTGPSSAVGCDEWNAITRAAIPPSHTAPAATCTTSKATISATGCWERVCPSNAKPVNATKPAMSPPIASPRRRSEPAGSMSPAKTSSADAVTPVEIPIGPRNDAARRSLSRSAPSPPPRRAMRSGIAASEQTAPRTAARPATPLTRGRHDTSAPATGATSTRNTQRPAAASAPA